MTKFGSEDLQSQGHVRPPPSETAFSRWCGHPSLLLGLPVLCCYDGGHHKYLVGLCWKAGSEVINFWCCRGESSCTYHWAYNILRYEWWYRESGVLVHTVLGMEDVEDWQDLSVVGHECHSTHVSRHHQVLYSRIFRVYTSVRWRRVASASTHGTVKQQCHQLD